MVAAINFMRVEQSGFYIEEAVISPEECADVLLHLGDASLQHGRAGVRHLMANPTICKLASDPRLLAIAERFIGASAIPYKATLFEKSAQVNWHVGWHQDRALPLQERFESEEWGSWTQKEGVLYAYAPTFALEKIVALRLHLDASTGDNGPLRALPGSHLLGALCEAEVNSYANANVGVECLVGQGGVLAMRPLVIHSSSKAKTDSPRRVIHIEYATCLDFGDGIRLAIA